MPQLTDELYWMSEEANDLITRLIDFRNTPQEGYSQEDAGRLDEGMSEALGHLMKAQSFLVSSALFARHNHQQIAC